VVRVFSFYINKISEETAMERNEESSRDSLSIVLNKKQELRMDMRYHFS
jgi:hypothetical protein